MYLTRSQCTETQSAFSAISCNTIHYSKALQIALRYHFISEHVEKGIIELDFVGTKYQLADLFTKALPPSRFVNLVHHIGMRCLTLDDLQNFLKT